MTADTTIRLSQLHLQEQRFFLIFILSDMRKDANLIRGQFWTKMWTFWIKPMSFNDVDQNNPQTDKNINR